MKIQIKGITDSTIVFSTVNMILRGNCNNKKLYPGSVVEEFEIENENQRLEIESLVKDGLIEVIVLEDTKSLKATINEAIESTHIEAKERWDKQIEEIIDVKVDVPEKPQAKEVSTEKEINDACNKEALKDADEEIVKTMVASVDNKKKTQAQMKKDEVEEVVATIIEAPLEEINTIAKSNIKKSSKAKSIKKLSSVDHVVENNNNLDVSESLKAAAKIREEEKTDYNESMAQSDLDKPEEDKDNEVYFITGNKQVTKSKTTRSLVDPDNAIANKSPFIDEDDESAKKIDELSKQAFIDEDDHDKDDKNSPFIEM